MSEYRKHLEQQIEIWKHLANPDDHGVWCGKPTPCPADNYNGDYWLIEQLLSGYSASQEALERLVDFCSALVTMGAVETPGAMKCELQLAYAALAKANGKDVSPGSTQVSDSSMEKRPR